LGAGKENERKKFFEIVKKISVQGCRLFNFIAIFPPLAIQGVATTYPLGAVEQGSESYQEDR